MENKKQKLLRVLLLIVLPALLVGQAVGQKVEPYGFAGDELIKVLFESDDGGETMTLSLGKNGNTSECVYEWEVYTYSDGARVPDIVSPTQPKTNVVFYDVGSYEFLLTRVSKYGYQQEYVTVMLYGGIKLVSATPVYPEKCWTQGDVVRDYNFDFTTEPPGYETRVHVAEADATIGSIAGDRPIKEKEIHFVIDGQPELERVKAVIPVTNTTQSFSVSITLTNNSPKKLKEHWEELQKATEKIAEIRRVNKQLNRPIIQGFFEKVKSMGKKAHLPVDPIHEFQIEPSFGMQCGCCNGDVMTFVNIGGTFRWALGVSMDVPIPGYYIPGIGGLAIWGQLQLEGNLFPLAETIPLTTKNYDECVQSSVGVGLAISGELEGGVEIISKDVASVGVGFDFKAEGNLVVQSAPPYVKPEGKGLKVYGKFDVHFLTCTATSSKYLLYPTIKEVESSTE